MTDLANLSDADLRALYQQSQGASAPGNFGDQYSRTIGAPVAGQPDPAGGGLASLSDDDLKALYQQSQPPSQSWGETLGSAVSNIGPSAGRFVSDLGQVIAHPIETAGNVVSVFQGLGEKGKRAVFGGDTGEHEKYADAVGQFFADRYGGIDNVKRTLAEDPIGFAADLSTILTGGSMAAARAAPTVSRAVGTVARAVDPINAAVTATGAVARGAGKVASDMLGVTTGVGKAPIQTAARAGFAGGDTARALTQGMREAAPIEDVVTEARSALQNIKDARQAAYKTDMANIGKDTTVLDFNKIDNSWSNARNTGSFQGKTSGISVPLRPSTEKAVAEIDSVMDQWRKLPPDDFHTPLGFDALKQRLGDIEKAATPGTPAKAVATQAYNIVKNQITAQAPEYAKTMANYQRASDLVREMERTLSLNRTANVDTQLRKLQSVMRDGVVTNYGARTKLVKTLQEAGATNIMQKLAGQSLSSIAPRGIARAAAGVTDLAVLASIIVNPAAWPALVGTLASQSPRLVGEAALAAGRAAKGVRNTAKVAVPAARAAFQAGRTEAPERTRR